MNSALQTQQNAPEYIAGFDEAAFAGPAFRDEPAPLKAAREEAFGLYKALPSPHARIEEWRRTDPARFPFAKPGGLKRLEFSSSFRPGPWDDQFDAVAAIGDGAFGIRDVTGVLKAKTVLVLPLAQAVAERPDLVAAYLRNPARGEAAGKFEALNDSFWNVGIFIHIPEGVELARGILIRCELAAPESVCVPRLLVAAGARSRAAVVEHLTSPDAPMIQTILSKQFHVASSANVRAITLQEWGANTYHIANDWARVERDGKLDWVTLNFGSRISKTSFGSDMAGEGASAELDGLYFATDEQHFDQRTLQVHSSARTASRLLYKGAVSDKARSVYQGLIVARPGANGVDAYQKNNNLVLSDGARVDSLPGLQIDTDDLKCSHGSTIGNLDPEELFYLRSRGLDLNEARRMLIKGFCEDITGRIPYEFVRDAVSKQVDARLKTTEYR